MYIDNIGFREKVVVSQLTKKRPKIPIVWLRIFSVFTSLLFFGLIVLDNLFLYFATEIPSYNELAQYQPPTITRVVASKDMSLLAEYGEERRIFVGIDNIPETLIQAFLSAEDQNFFRHTGFDVGGMIRAVLQNFQNLKDNKRLVGASTITQQVVKSFFLSNIRTVKRKVVELILAYRVNKMYSKKRILELYLNKIFLGHGAYGVAAAAFAYFDKNLTQLSIAESAVLASLPKAPSEINPYVNYERAKERRNWVLYRMHRNGFIEKEQYQKFIDEPIVLKTEKNRRISNHFSYVDAVRRDLIKKYGQNALNTAGMTVLTNIDPQIQNIAQKTLDKHLIEYESAKKFAGPIAHIDVKNSLDIEAEFLAIKSQLAQKPYYIAIVIGSKPNHYLLALQGLGSNISPKMSLKSIIAKLSTQNKKHRNNKVRMHDQKAEIYQSLFTLSKNPEYSLKVGDVVLVQIDGKGRDCTLKQLPKVNGAIIVAENYTGKVLASVGGISNDTDVFNRVMQARRQPGSLFKTIVYLSALENGYNINSILSDAPIALNMGNGKIWRPKNITNRFLGDIPMIEAFARSANLATIRLVMILGFERILDTAHQFNIYNNISHKDANLSMALGTAEDTLFSFANIFVIFASSGLKVKLRYIDSIFSADGDLIYFDTTLKHGHPPQNSNFLAGWTNFSEATEVTNDSGKIDPTLIAPMYYEKYRLIDNDTNLEMVKMLRAVVQQGSGFGARKLGYDVMLKTGTTNDSKDVWCVGSSQRFTVGVYVGYDIPKDMGKEATGTKLAVPIFVDVLEQIAAKSSGEIGFMREEHPIIEARNSRRAMQNSSTQESRPHKTFIASSPGIDSYNNDSQIAREDLSDHQDSSNTSSDHDTKFQLQERDFDSINNMQKNNMHKKVEEVVSSNSGELDSIYASVLERYLDESPVMISPGEDNERK